MTPTIVQSTTSGFYACIDTGPVWWQAHLVDIGFSIALLAFALLIVMVASHIPYWAETDRLWKTGEDTPDTEEKTE